MPMTKARKREYDQARHAANRESILASRRAAYAANPQRFIEAAQAWKARNGEWVRAYFQQRHRDDPRRLLESNRRWRAANPEKMAACRAAWAAVHPESKRLAEGRRRAQLLTRVTAAVSSGQWAAILEYFDHRCAYCERRARVLTVDHVTALAVGGYHSADNVVPACAPCNSKKGARGVLYMLRRPTRAAGLQVKSSAPTHPRSS